MKSEVYKRKVDTRDEFLARILEAAASIKEREDQLRRITRDPRARVAKCTEVSKLCKGFGEVASAYVVIPTRRKDCVHQKMAHTVGGSNWLPLECKPETRVTAADDMLCLQVGTLPCTAVTTCSRGVCVSATITWRGDGWQLPRRALTH
jgi:hypothetical protein